jgi:hypothetical protein
MVGGLDCGGGVATALLGADGVSRRTAPARSRGGGIVPRGAR